MIGLPGVVVEDGVVRLHQLLIDNIAVPANDSDPREFIALGGVAHLTV